MSPASGSGAGRTSAPSATSSRRTARVGRRTARSGHSSGGWTRRCSSPVPWRTSIRPQAIGGEHAAQDHNHTMAGGRLVLAQSRKRHASLPTGAHAHAGGGMVVDAAAPAVDPTVIRLAALRRRLGAVAMIEAAVSSALLRRRGVAPPPAPGGVAASQPAASAAALRCCSLLAGWPSDHTSSAAVRSRRDMRSRGAYAFLRASCRPFAMASLCGGR